MVVYYNVTRPNLRPATVGMIHFYLLSYFIQLIYIYISVAIVAKHHTPNPGIEPWPLGRQFPFINIRLFGQIRSDNFI